VVRRIHAPMKDANERDTVIREAKVNHMPLDITAVVPLTNMITGWNRVRRFGQDLERRRQQLDVSLSLFKSSFFARVFLNAFQVALTNTHPDDDSSPRDYSQEGLGAPTL
jgi:hypothetical protein